MRKKNRQSGKKNSKREQEKQSFEKLQEKINQEHAARERLCLVFWKNITFEAFKRYKEIKKISLRSVYKTLEEAKEIIDSTDRLGVMKVLILECYGYDMDNPDSYERIQEHLKNCTCCGEDFDRIVGTKFDRDYPSDQYSYDMQEFFTEQKFPNEAQY